MPRGSYTKAFLTTSVTAADAATASSAMNVPLVAAGLQGMRGAVGIQIWSIEIEFTDMPVAASFTDKMYFEVFLSQTPITGVMYVNNRDVIWKHKVMAHWITGAQVAMIPMVIDKDFYPAIPFYGQQLHLGIVNQFDCALTIYCKVWYLLLILWAVAKSMVQLSQSELVQQLQNQLT